FVDDHQVRIGHPSFNVRVRRAIANNTKIRKGLVKRRNRSVAMLLAQVSQAPSILRLQDNDIVAALLELGRDAPEKMRVAVIPVGNDGMIEETDFHAKAGACSSVRRG